jgi:hypothetical protein
MIMGGMAIGTIVITTRTTTGANIAAIIGTRPAEWMAGMTVPATITSAVSAVKVVSAFPGRPYMFSRRHSLSSHRGFTCDEPVGYLQTLPYNSGFGDSNVIAE